MLKAVIGDTEAITEQIEELQDIYQYAAETAVEIVPAPHHYSVNGKTMYYNYQDFIWTLCVEFGIEDYFTYLLAQFYHESGFNQYAVSYTSDYGICQLNANYHAGFKRMVGHTEWDVIDDPYANMYIGVYLMATYIKNRGGDIELAWTDYNAGAGYTAKYGVRYTYVNKIYSAYSTIKELD